VIVESSPYSPQTDIRSYTIFDLSGITGGSISSGNLRLYLHYPSAAFWSSYNQSSESVAVYDVGTNLNTLIGLPAGNVYPYSTGWSYHDDLGGGALYGNTTVTVNDLNTWVSMPLTAQAIADINAAAGTAFGIGVDGTSGPSQSNRFGPVQLSLHQFNDPVEGGGGIDFELDDGDVTGGGTVDLTPKGGRHRLSAYALDQQTTDQQFSELRRRFRYSASTTEPQMLYLIGDLDGDLFAQQGTAKVDASLQIYDTTNGLLVDQTSFFDQIVSLPAADPVNKPVDSSLEIGVELIPGRTYEMISRLELEASINDPAGRAQALFGSTFDVTLEVAEPASLVMLPMAFLCLGRRRRRGT
jgi:hypothetical protein